LTLCSQQSRELVGFVSRGKKSACYAGPAVTPSLYILSMVLGGTEAIIRDMA